MEDIHKKALQKTRTRLVRDLDPNAELQDMLVSETIFTPIMLEYIQAEKTRSEKVRRLLDDLVRRGPRAYAIFLKCLRDSEHGDLANAVEDNEYRLRGLPVPPRTECQERRGQSEVTLPVPMTVSTGQPPHGSYTPSQGYSAQQFQPSQENDPLGSLFAPSGSSFNQGLANQMSGNSRAPPGHGVSGQRNEDMMEVADTPAEVALDLPPSTAEPVQSAYQRLPVERRYKMESNPRGLCLIINNKNYTDMSTRTGTDVNRDQLEDLFRRLQFGVDIKNDLTGMEMKRHLEDLSRIEDLTGVDSLVICILCHGDNENVHGTDGVALNLLNDVFKIFGPLSCPALIGKPKLFVLNSCRGDARDVGNHFNTIGNHVTGGSSEADVTCPRPQNVTDVRPVRELRLPETNPSYKDLYIAYSTFPGHVSYRNTEGGSWFIQKLVEVFNEEASIHEIDIMMREVKRRVANEYDEQSLEVQMPAPANTLTKQWYFNPV